MIEIVITIDHKGTVTIKDNTPSVDIALLSMASKVLDHEISKRIAKGIKQGTGIIDGSIHTMD